MHMDREIPRAYKIVSHQFLTLLRIEVFPLDDQTPLDVIVEVLQRRSIPIRFFNSDLMPEGSMTFNLGLDLLPDEIMEEVLIDLARLKDRREVAFISQVSMALVYGPHFGEVPGIAGAAYAALASAGLSPLAVSASASSLSYLFPSVQFKAAMEQLTAVFKPPLTMVEWE